MRFQKLLNAKYIFHLAKPITIYNVLSYFVQFIPKAPSKNNETCLYVKKSDTKTMITIVGCSLAY